MNCGTAERSAACWKRSWEKWVAWCFVAGMLALGRVAAADEAAGGGGADPMRAFVEANAMLESGDAAAAIPRYQRLLGAFEGSASLHYNLGMAFFRQGQMGWAAGHWRIAERLEPRRRDVRVALALVDGKLGPGRGRSVWARWDALCGYLTLNEWTGLALALIWVWALWRVAAAGAPAIGFRTRGWVRVAGALALICAALLAGTGYSRVARPAAVVVVKEESARTGPLVEARVLDRLREGEEVRVTGRREGWMQILLPGSGRRAWVPKQSLLEIPAF